MLSFPLLIFVYHRKTVEGKERFVVGGIGRICGFGCPVLSGESSESDRFFDLRYSVGTKVLRDLEKHCRFIYITQNSNGVRPNPYSIFQPEV